MQSSKKTIKQLVVTMNTATSANKKAEIQSEISKTQGPLGKDCTVQVKEKASEKHGSISQSAKDCHQQGFKNKHKEQKHQCNACT